MNIKKLINKKKLNKTKKKNTRWYTIQLRDN